MSFNCDNTRLLSAGGKQLCNFLEPALRLGAAGVVPLDAVVMTVAAAVTVGRAASHAERAHQRLVGGALDIMAIKVNGVAVAVEVARGGVSGAAIGGASAALVRDLHAVVIAVATTRGVVRAAVGVLVGDGLAGAAVNIVAVQVDVVAIAIGAASSTMVGNAGVGLTVDVNVAALIGILVPAVAVALHSEFGEAHAAKDRVVAASEGVPVEVDEVAAAFVVHAGVLHGCATGVAGASISCAFADERLGGGASVVGGAHAAIGAGSVRAGGAVDAGRSRAGTQVAGLLAGGAVSMPVAAANAIGIVGAGGAGCTGTRGAGGSAREVLAGAAGGVSNAGDVDGGPTTGVFSRGAGGAGTSGSSGTATVVLAGTAATVVSARTIADGVFVLTD